MNRRHLATKIATRLRLTSVLERLGSRPALAVLVYHRILKPEGHRYDKDVIEATPDQFDEQMALLKKRYAVIDPEELSDVIANPRKLRHFRVAITFDDAYLDNYTFAFPILKSHGLRATFFMPTHYVDTRYIPWWDQVAFAVRSSTRSVLQLSYPKPVSIDRSDIDVAVRTMLRAYTRAENVSLEKYLAAVEEACGVPLPAEAEERQFMSWNEAVEMESAGMAMGSHTHSHGILGNMTADEQRKECADSRGHLKAKNLKADTIAYPVGKPNTFSRTTIEAVKEAGYRCAFSNYGGINLPDQMDPFDVKRIGMNLDEELPQLRLRLALTRMSRRQVW